MRIFAIRDEYEPGRGDAAYLFYYEREKQFYIELPDGADPWETPLILSSMLSRGEMTVDAYWSKVWVQQRIIPPDRQNIGQILRDNRLDSYDEFQLLIRADGRCAQDDYYISEIHLEDLPQSILARFEHRVEDIAALPGRRLLVFFRNSEAKLCDLTELLSGSRAFAPILKNDDYFQNVRLQVGGYGISWGEQLTIPDHKLYQTGVAVPLSHDDLAAFVRQRVVTTAEAAQLLDCSKQNVDDLVRRGKLHPLKETPKGKLFFKNEVVKRLWN